MGIMLNIVSSRWGVDMDKIDNKSPLKEWRRPALRKLPIAVASTGTIKPSLNEGTGVGKGNAGASVS
jgi:hypothetical protein